MDMNDNPDRVDEGSEDDFAEIKGIGI